MNPLHLTARNLRTFRELDLDVPSGCCVIGGENGAGKSTILAAIDAALFAGRGELASLLTLGEDALELELLFEHAGERYRVRRAFRRGKTTLDFERLDTHRAAHGQAHPEPLEDWGWMPLTRETADQTQQLIERILGLSRATFRASSFLAQGDGAAFTEASPRDRKAILAEILGLEVWDGLLVRARADLRGVEDELLVTRGRASTLEEELDGVDAAHVLLKDAKVQRADALARHLLAARDLERAERALAENAVAAERARAARQAHVTAQQEQERLRQEYAAAVQAGVEREHTQAQLEVASSQAAEIPRLEGLLVASDEQLAVSARRDRLAAQLRDLEDWRAKLVDEARTFREFADEQIAKAAHIETHIDEAGTCEHCGQTLGREAAMHAAASYREEALGLQVKAGLIEQSVKDTQGRVEAARAELAMLPLPKETTPISYVQSMLAEARAADVQRAMLAERVRTLAELAATSDERAITLAHANDTVRETALDVSLTREGVGDEEELAAAVLRARHDADLASSELDDRKADVTRLEAQVARLDAAASELAELTMSLGGFQRQIDLLKLAERAYGPDGIPALIVENAAIPQLELEANRILGELGGATADCRVELRTQRALKTSARLRETLDIVIVTPGGVRPYETFSGGERTRLNLALRIALARLLAHRRGAESRLLAIDEPDGLDAQGMDALAAILQGLAGDFDKILVVSHQPQLATSFDQALMVVKDGERSRLEQGAPLEPLEEVAA